VRMEPDIDCTGLRCPEPVLRTKKMIESECGPFTVLVDNDSARDNVLRFAKTAGCAVEAEDRQGGWLLSVVPQADASPRPSTPGGEVEAAPAVECASQAGTGKVFYITSDEIGKGEPELGRTLMKMFLYAAAESDAPPSALIFLNSGIKLVTENDETAAHVAKLEAAGADVLVCGTCLDYYGLKDELKAGRVSNMYEIQATIVGAGLLVSI
jgi:selenium metabolism protein YedF